MINAVFAGLAAMLIVLLITPLVRRLAWHYHIVDDPHCDSERRAHAKPTALLGGWAVWLAIVVILGGLMLINEDLLASYLKKELIVGMILASGVLMIGGYFDDRYRLSPYLSIWFPVAAAIIVIASGVGINFVTRPWGGVWRLDSWKIALFHFGDATYFFNVWADILVFFWLMGMMYTTKLLDGLDGLTSGVAAIGATTLAALSLTVVVHQPDTALVAAVVAGSFLGFLYYNWFPAAIFLGESGSLLAGFMLGVLAIIAGGKIATTLLVIGLPVFDLAWVVARRLFWDHTPLALADRKHLHFRLLDAGLTPRQTVYFFWSLSAALGVVALMFQTRGKLLAFLLFIVMTSFLAVFIARAQRKVAAQ